MRDLLGFVKGARVAGREDRTRGKMKIIHAKDEKYSTRYFLDEGLSYDLRLKGTCLQGFVGTWSPGPMELHGQNADVAFPV